MNLHALYHKPQSEYAFAVSRDRSVIRFRAARGDLAKVELAVRSKFFWRTQTRVTMRLNYSDSLFDYYECEIDTDKGRRLYFFDLYGADGTRMFYTECGAQPPCNEDTVYFPVFQIPFLSECDVHIVPDKFKGATIYQIFPDRFYTRSPKTWFGKKPKADDIFGGDLYGATEKLDHVRSLGMNTVYLTPIHPSHTNHHYDVENYYTVADEFGGEDALKAFITKAHSLGIKVLLDGVFNHCSAQNPMFRDVMQKGRTSEYYDWFTIYGDKPDFHECNYETFGLRTAYMPKLNCDNAKVRDFVCDVTTFWIKNYGIDGWRLDVADDVSPHLWREVRKAVKRADRDAILIGEDWMDANAFLGGDVFDGVMNYGFFNAVRDWLAQKNIDAAGAAERLIRTYLRTSGPSARLMMNLIGSHDTPRFFTFCNGNIFDFQAAMATMFFFDGMPTVYYGDELPMRGGQDPDCRRGYDWDAPRSTTADLIKLLADMRTGDPESKHTEIRADHGALVIKRSGSSRASLVINATEADIKTDGGTLDKRSMLIDINGETHVVRE